MIVSTATSAKSSSPAAGVGREMHALIAELFPICRSIAGPGVRETLSIIGERIPLDIHETPTGTKVFDWTAPREWRIRDAYVRDSSGKRVIDFRKSNLHVVNYSTAFRGKLSKGELRPHLHSDPARPDVIPYRTSYYRPDWGFCLSDNALLAMPDELYDVCIDAEHYDGALAYGECVVRGATEDEVLISAHVCHPSLANDNLSGVAVAVQLARWAAAAPRRYTYRFVFAPGTIGALCWLAKNADAHGKVQHGLVLTLLGDGGDMTYKRSRRGDAAIDRAMEHVLRTSGRPFEVIDFTPFGYDERQYCSPGFDLPVGRIMRTRHEKYAHYHSSADGLDAVLPESLAHSYATCVSALELLEQNRAYKSLNPYGEPQLGRRGLYGQPLAGVDRSQFEQAVLWTLNLSDGGHDLLAIAERSQLPFDAVLCAANALVEAKLLAPIDAFVEPATCPT
jgi:aminopeptidase-like protein